MATVSYDTLSDVYREFRRPDRRIASALRRALGDVRSIVNVGAGMGAYEPEVDFVVAVDPSWGMISKRPSVSSGVLAVAEQLPFKDRSFDAALAILTIHHWREPALGLREALRVSRKRVVILTWLGFPDGFWLSEYVPEVEEFDRLHFPAIELFREILGPVQVHPVSVPSDCTDGFLCAYWARPEYYLDKSIRSAISTFSRIPASETGLARLREDLRSGRWDHRFGHLRHEESHDYGYRILVSERTGA